MRGPALAAALVLTAAGCAPSPALPLPADASAAGRPEPPAAAATALRPLPASPASASSSPSTAAPVSPTGAVTHAAPSKPGAAATRSAIDDNENAAIGTLRSLAMSQDQFQNGSIVDQDGDGTGEFGWLGELAGVAPCRVTRLRMNSSPYIAAVLGARDADGIVQRRGYCFRMYLPGRTGHRTEGNGEAGEPADEKAANNQECRWIAYAWPILVGVTGRRAFMVNQAGDVWGCANTVAWYSGPGRGPTASAALDTAGPDPDALDAGIGSADAGRRSFDGERWVPAGS